jgi:hypothetical protein
MLVVDALAAPKSRLMTLAEDAFSEVPNGIALQR